MNVRPRVKKVGEAEFALRRGRAYDVWRDTYARSYRPWQRAAEAQIAHAAPESDPSSDVHEQIAEAAGEVAMLAAACFSPEDPARDRIISLAARGLVIGTFPEHITKEGGNE